MPERSNEFQSLVKLIHQALAPKGAKVTESKLVSAPGFGDLREIDVLIESEVSPYSIKVAVEAKDHKRKLNILDIEAIIGKYRSGSSHVVDKVVLVSRNGFTKPAAKKAKLEGIELRILSESKASDWQSVVPLGKGKHMLNFTMQPHLISVTFNPPPDVQLPERAFTAGRILCRCHGKDHGGSIEYANHIFKHHLFANKDLTDKMNEALKSQPELCAKVEWPMEQFTLNLDGKQHYLRTMILHFHMVKATVPLALKSYALTGEGVPTKEMRHLCANIGSKTFQIVMPNEPHPEQIILDISNLSEKRDQSNK